MLLTQIAVLALTFGTGADATPRPKSAVHDAGARHAVMIARLVRRGDPAAVDYVVRTVAAGMPPRSIEAFLEATPENPKLDYVPALRELASYRKKRYRALALVALASLDDDYGAEAALRAMDDPSLDVRLLGLALAEKHTAPHVEEAKILLLDRDARIAKIVAAHQPKRARPRFR